MTEYLSWWVFGTGCAMCLSALFLAFFNRRMLAYYKEQADYAEDSYDLWENMQTFVGTILATAFFFFIVGVLTHAYYSDAYEAGRKSVAPVEQEVAS